MDIVTYALCKKLINKTLEGAGALVGKTAFDIAVENGFEGTEQDWLDSLKGKDGYTPYIGENGNWFINGEDTNFVATSGIKISSVDGNKEIVFDEQDRTIYSIGEDNSKTIIANYESTAPIEELKIEKLFV